MLRITPFPNEALKIRLSATTGWTAPHEVQCLIHYASAIGGGDILEVGCNEGEVTRELALAFPDRKVIGVDWTHGESTMAPEQRGERPAIGRAGARAKSLANVRIIDCPSTSLSVEEHGLQTVRVVFIDGDHTFDGVKADSEKWIAHFEKQGAPWCILWHDAQEDAPPWVGVCRYLTRLARDKFPLSLSRIEGTRVAVLFVPWE